MPATGEAGSFDFGGVLISVSSLSGVIGEPLWMEISFSGAGAAFARAAEGSPEIAPETERCDTGRRRTKSFTTVRGAICQSTQTTQATVTKLTSANRRQNSVEPNRLSPSVDGATVAASSGRPGRSRCRI